MRKSQGGLTSVSLNRLDDGIRHDILNWGWVATACSSVSTKYWKPCLETAQLCIRIRPPALHYLPTLLRPHIKRMRLTVVAILGSCQNRASCETSAALRCDTSNLAYRPIGRRQAPTSYIPPSKPIHTLAQRRLGLWTSPAERHFRYTTHIDIH